MFIWISLLLLGIVVSALVTYLVVMRRQTLQAKNLELNLLNLQNDLAGRDRDLVRLEADLQSVRGERNHFEAQYHQLMNAKTEIETTLKEREKNFEEKMALFSEAETKLTDTFQALSAAALKENAKSFLTLAGQNFENLKLGANKDMEARKVAVENLVKPLQESLEKVSAKMGDIEKNRIASESQLGSQLRALGELQGQLQKETGNLANALKSPQVRGRWGEIQLKRVVELAGMLEHCDFVTQASVAGPDGQLRPDMIIKLPNGKNIVVDAKASGLAYLEALETTDEAARLLKMKAHSRQVRDQLVKLSSKAYWQEFNPAPEFVVLFLPAESFFSAALEHDKTLLEFGAESKVLMATPTTLIALLRAVAFGWRQENLSQNAKEISELGKQLYERLITGTNYVDDLRHNLEKVIQSFNKFIGNFESRVLSTARKFSELDIGGEEQITALEPVDETPRTLQLIKGKNS